MSQVKIEANKKDKELLSKASSTEENVTWYFFFSNVDSTLRCVRFQRIIGSGFRPNTIS